MKRKIIKRDEKPLSLKEVEWLYKIVIDCVKNDGDGFTFFCLLIFRLVRVFN